MEDDREGDVRVPLISFLFCLCLITGGIFLALYVFVPNLSQPWYPIAAFGLIGLPWIFWLLTLIYTCMKGCCYRGRDGGAVDSGQISRRQTTRNVSNSASAAAAMQNNGNGGGGGGGNQQGGGVNTSVASSSRESEMPLTYSGLWKPLLYIYTPDGEGVSTVIWKATDHLAQLCLSTLQPSLLYSVCLSWRQLIYSPSFPPFFSLYAVLCRTPSTKYPFIKSDQLDRCQCQPNSIAFVSFDPISSTWRALPALPTDPPLCILRQHPSFISRILSIQSLTVSGRLVLIAATTHKLRPALTYPLVFNPLSSKWYFGPPFSSPRRWCVAGSINGGIYVASGTGAQYHGEVARSMERWDMSQKDVDWHWETRASFKDGRFSREAVEALGYKGKLFMVNVKGKAVKEGAVYDVVMNQWQEMPKGMLDGWNGPAAVDNDSMYVVDQENGSLSRYNADRDCWEELIEPCELLKGAEHISAHKGKICAVFANGGKIVVADSLAKPAKVWVVNPPQGMEVISVHILPRMSILFKRLLGKVAVITGGARGIGAATAKLFSDNGAHVVIADILDDLGTELANSIQGRYIHCDVSEESDVEQAIHLAVKWKGRLDIMFNNAGISGTEGSITNLKMDQMMTLLSINLNGVVHGIKHAARVMINGKKGGSIICSSSSAAIMGGLASHAYTLSKEAILGVARSTACELGAHGIRVNCVSPHGVPSEMLVAGYRRILGREDLRAEDVSKIVGESGSLLRGRGASVDDVAGGVLFLASEEAGFITGHNLVIDGGYTSACSHMSFIYQG